MPIVSNYLLIDSSCGITGYVEDLRGDLCSDARQITELCHRFGIGALRDNESGIVAKSRFKAVSRNLKIIGGVLAITDGQPLTRNEIMVTSQADLKEIIALCSSLGERWLGVRSANPEFFAAVHAMTSDVGILICGRGAGAYKAIKMNSVQLIDGVAALLPDQVSAIDALKSASKVQDDEWDNLTDLLFKHNVQACTGLLSLRRTVFLKEAIQAPYLDQIIPILPHTQYLLRMRQHVGYLAGKRALEQHSGMREPSNKEQ